MENKKDIQYSIDMIKVGQNNLTIIGWASSEDPHDKVYIDVTDQSGKSIKYRKERTQRRDACVARYGLILDELYGFTLSFPYSPNEIYLLRFFNSTNEKIIKISKHYIYLENLYKNIASFLWRKPLHDLGNTKSLNYNSWYKRTAPKQNELAEQKRHAFPADAPKFSIVIPLYNTPDHFLNDLIHSIQQQTYTNFEVCFADGSPEENKLENKVAAYSNNDSRFKYHFIGSNKGISENTNEAVKMADGDFIVLCDHDDLITSNALYEFAKAIVDQPDCDTIYSDEDKINSEGTKLFEPHFKPDFNEDLLNSENYICHLFGVRRTLVKAYGAFDSNYDGSQDYDFILRMTEHSRRTVHIAKILYHWRTHQNSTSANPESKMYAFEAGARALKAHWQRVWPEIKIKDVENGPSLGIYRTYFEVDPQPLVSVIIPNMDHTDDLDKAIRSLIDHGTWHNLEFIVIENNSQDPATFEYYKKIEKELPQVHVIYYKEGFNYSKLNNFGVQHAHGEYFLFMNNDVELIEPDSVLEMIGYAQRPNVGVVGCRLLYDDNTIQHAGVVIGINGVAGHVFQGHYSENDSYFNLAMVAQDYSAVTAAVMMVKRTTFEQVNGFDENFAVAFNDIDFCLRIRRLNKLVVYTPYASFHHYESKSRGAEDTYAKQVRFVSEIKRFVSTWKDIIMNGDPYYNPNLTVHSNDYSYRNLNIEQVGDSFYGKKYIADLMAKSPEDIVKSNQGW